MSRICFAIKEGWKNRHRLKQFLKDRSKQIYQLNDITAEKMDAANIAILILDFDGVLAAHDALEPTQEVHEWLTRLALAVGEQRLAVFSNQPKLARMQYFKRHFPSVHFVTQVRKKPYPDGILEVAAYRGLAPHRVALLDDRLLTGMLATCLAYSQGWYYVHPRQNFCRHPFKESVFSLLRTLEKMMVRWA